MKTRTALLAALLLLVTACQPATGGGSRSTSVSGPLAAADARLHSGDYVGAETAYRKLAEGGDAAAMAHYALLLDYENRFTDALRVAGAAASSTAGSIALGSLTRSLDWSEDVPAALDAGARAVKASPGDPLAHAFYSEALADAAHFPAARAQLKQAEKLAKDPYSASEVEREWANYYRGQGDTLEELNHLQLSLRAQPGFPERVLELVRFRYADQEQATARQLLAGLRKQHGGDYGVDVAAADTALIQGDLDTAEPFYRAALKLQPAGTSASLGEAELLVSGRRDFQGAHDLLLAALKASPDSVDVYYFLYYLDQLVLKTDPAAELDAIQPKAPSQPGDAAQQALDRVNALRSAIGLPAVSASDQINAAARAHAYFWLFNYGQPALAGTKIHTEDPTLPGAFAADPLARAQHFGYAGTRMSEVISHVYQPSAAIHHWVDAVFHRYPLSDPETVSAGFGEAVVGALSIQVLDLGQGAGGKHQAVVYPVPEQSAVPFAFLGAEIPDPAPGAHYPTGYPITLQVGSASTLKVTEAELDGPDGSPLDGYVLDSTNSELAASEWGVLPRDPLQPGGRYTVKVAGTVDDQPFSKDWSFTVAPSPS